MAPRLNQILAASQGVAARTDSRWMEILNTLGKEPLLSGITRRYRPRADDGEQLPNEDKDVQVRAHEQLEVVRGLLTQLWDVTATKDAANTRAAANVTLPGRSTPLLENAPVTLLLYLEKQVAEWRDFVRKLPVLDPAVAWTFNEDAQAYATPVITTARQVQKPVPVVLYPATTEHPAQVQLSAEQHLAGYWDKVDYSGKLPGQVVQDMLDRADILLASLKAAREEANMTEAEPASVGTDLMAFLIDGA
ncbi:MAG TPA: hypothetical protein VGH76_07645 [Actinomycetospora sp.]|uniref:DUF7873 family protein n=1 Tax=Actinomycetospora sp. TaxID=1872135 RepID=UPI002F426342